MSWKILIADDESDIVAMLGSFFESRGFCVLHASNGAEALRQAEKQPDIILLDINMPGNRRTGGLPENPGLYILSDPVPDRPD